MKTLGKHLSDSLEYLGEKGSENKKDTKNKKRIEKSTDICMLDIKSGRGCCGKDQKLKLNSAF